jgi:uncharacterized membrane protein
MPPLCVVRISLAMGNYAFAFGAFLLYLTNLLGITLACMIAFIFSGYTKVTKALGWTTLLTMFLMIPLGASFFRLSIIILDFLGFASQPNLRGFIVKLAVK